MQNILNQYSKLFVQLADTLKGGRGGDGHKDSNTMASLVVIIKHIGNQFTLHGSDLAAWAASLDPHLGGLVSWQI